MSSPNQNFFNRRPPGVPGALKSNRAFMTWRKVSVFLSYSQEVVDKPLVSFYKDAPYSIYLGTQSHSLPSWAGVLGTSKRIRYRPCFGSPFLYVRLPTHDTNIVITSYNVKSKPEINPQTPTGVPGSY